MVIKLIQIKYEITHNGIFGVNLDEDQPSNSIFGGPYPTSRFETNTEPGCLMVLPAFSILSLKFSIYCILDKVVFFHLMALHMTRPTGRMAFTPSLPGQ